jgi:hypothetical protein
MMGATTPSPFSSALSGNLFFFVAISIFVVALPV